MNVPLRAAFAGGSGADCRPVAFEANLLSLLPIQIVVDIRMSVVCYNICMRLETLSFLVCALPTLEFKSELHTVISSCTDTLYRCVRVYGAVFYYGKLYYVLSHSWFAVEKHHVSRMAFVRVVLSASSDKVCRHQDTVNISFIKKYCACAI